MPGDKPAARSHRRLWAGVAVLSIVGGLGYWLYTAVDRVRESAARSN